MRRLGVVLLAAVAMLIVIGAFRAIPATASQVSGLAGTSAARSAGKSAAGATSGSPAVSAVTPTSGPVSAGSSGQPQITREIAHFPRSSETPGGNSIAIDPVKVGDLVVLSMQLHTTGISITGITGGNVGSWQRAVAYKNTGTDTLYYEVWWGVATATGPSAVNISYSADVSQWAIELIADSFTTASALPWAVVASGGSSNPSSSSASWPALKVTASLTSSIGGRPKKSLQPLPHRLRDSPAASPHMATASFTTAGWLRRRGTLRRAANHRPASRQRSESSSLPAARPGGRSLWSASPSSWPSC